MIKLATVATLVLVAFTSVVSSSKNEDLLASLSHMPTKEQFKTFHMVHEKEKQYPLNSLEGIRRYKIFKANLRIIRQHNSDPSNIYRLGITSYADITQDEFEGRNKKFKINMKKIKQAKPPKVGAFKSYPSIDWTTKVKTPAKKDGGWNCDDSYLLAMADTFEYWNYFSTGEVKIVSPQNYHDCLKGYDCTMYNSQEWNRNYNFWHDNGMHFEEEYPYLGKKGSQCQEKNTKKLQPTTWDFPVLGNYDTDSVYAALKKGPIFFCLSKSVNRLYTGGVFNKYNSSILCGWSVCVDGAATLVGFGLDQATSTEYWLAKTTFGSDWGEEGYIRIARNDRNQNLGLNCLYLRPVNS